MAVGVPKFEGLPREQGDMGMPILAVRQDGSGILSGVADGEYTPLQVDSDGYLKVTSTGGGGGGGTEYTEGGTDATITGPAIMWEDTSDTLRAVSAAKPLPVNVVAGSTSGTEYTEGNTDATITGTAILWEDAADTLATVSAASPLPVELVTPTAVPVTDNGGSLTVDGSVTADTELPTAAALADATSNPTTPIVGAAIEFYNGTTWDRARGDTTNGLDVDVTRMPAAARTTDSMAVALQTDAIMSNLTALTPKFAIVSGATNGNNTLVAAVTSKKIRVLALYVVAAGTTTVRFEDGAGGTALTGVVSLIANTGFCLPFNPVGWMETSSNTLLNMELNAAVQVSGCLVYVEV